MEIKKMAKSGNFNVNVDENTAKAFDDWSEKTPGKKYEHIVGALNAIQAIYAINKTLAVELMDKNLSHKDAVDIVKRGIVDSWLRGWIDFPTEKDLHEIFTRKTIRATAAKALRQSLPSKDVKAS